MNFTTKNSLVFFFCRIHCWLRIAIVADYAQELVKLLCLMPSLQDYPKLSQNYYGLLECLAQDHMTFVASLEPQVFLYILSTISEGLVALGESLSSLSLYFHLLSFFSPHIRTGFFDSRLLPIETFIFFRVEKEHVNFTWILLVLHFCPLFFLFLFFLWSSPSLFSYLILCYEAV